MGWLFGDEHDNYQTVAFIPYSFQFRADISKSTFVSLSHWRHTAFMLKVKIYLWQPKANKPQAKSLCLPLLSAMWAWRRVEVSPPGGRQGSSGTTQLSAPFHIYHQRFISFILVETSCSRNQQASLCLPSQHPGQAGGDSPRSAGNPPADCWPPPWEEVLSWPVSGTMGESWFLRSVSHSSHFLHVSQCLATWKCSGNTFMGTTMTHLVTMLPQPTPYQLAYKLMPLGSSTHGQVSTEPAEARLHTCTSLPDFWHASVLHLTTSWEVEAASELIYPSCTHEEQSLWRTWLSSSGRPTSLQFCIHYILLAFTNLCLADAQLFCRTPQQNNMYILPPH